MQVLKLTGTIDSNGHLQLNVPTELPAGDVELVLVISPTFSKKANQNYNFSDLAGKLSLEGNPITIAKEMRDAW